MAPTVWYHVRNLDEGRRFYRDVLGFEELAVDFEAGWSTLRRGEMEIGLAVGEPSEAGVAHVDVAELRRMRCLIERVHTSALDVAAVHEMNSIFRAETANDFRKIVPRICGE